MIALTKTSTEVKYLMSLADTTSVPELLSLVLEDYIYNKYIQGVILSTHYLKKLCDDYLQMMSNEQTRMTVKVRKQTI